jgi:Cellulase (glycosyl hydrolase family 5)
VLNAHHERYLYRKYTGAEEQNDKFFRLWSRIAERYRGVDHNMLVFEVINEPQGVFGTFVPGTYGPFIRQDDGTAIELTRQINKTGFDGIRSKDKKRTISLCPNSFQGYTQMQLIYPNREELPMSDDKHLMVSAHVYEPFAQFCDPVKRDKSFFKGGPTGTKDEIRALREHLDRVIGRMSYWYDEINKGVPDSDAIGFWVSTT